MDRSLKYTVKELGWGEVSSNLKKTKQMSQKPLNTVRTLCIYYWAKLNALLDDFVNHCFMLH